MMILLSLLSLAEAAPSLSSLGTTRVQVSLEQASAETPARKQEIAAAALEEIAASVREVDKVVERATKSSDPGARETELKCISPKATQLKSLDSLARKSQGDMVRLISAGDIAHADQQIRRVLVALSRARELIAEARSCTSGEGLAGAAPDVEVTSSSESLVEVPEADATVVEPPMASPN